MVCPTRFVIRVLRNGAGILPACRTSRIGPAIVAFSDVIQLRDGEIARALPEIFAILSRFHDARAEPPR